MMNSSYIANQFDQIFKAIVSAYMPSVCVELGVLEGYSTIAIASELKRNHEKYGSSGHLNAYDLFEKYPYRHSTIKETQENIEKKGLGEYVSLYSEDAFKVHEKYNTRGVDFLHVDLSNTGETVRKIMETWDSKIDIGGVICFEGGSEERDQVPWMIKYNKDSVKDELERNKIIERNYVFGTYFQFPSLTCLLKKRI